MPAVLADRCYATIPELPAAAFRYRDDETITLSSDEYFLLGDHQQTSGDSRLSGPALRTAVVGVVDLIYWPPPRVKILRW
jgi:hypothetical protein